MIPARRASQEAAVAVYGNDEGADGVTSSNKYVTFEQEAENKKKKKTGAKPAAGTGSDRRATRVSLDSLLCQVKHDKGGMSEKEKRLMKVLNDLDADHDGTVSLMEIAELGSKLEQAEEDEKKLKKIVGVLSLLLIGSLLAIFIMSYAAAEAAKEVRGFIVFYPQQRHVHIENVAVDPQFQGKGYGRQLIQYAEQHARRSGYGQVKLYTNIKMSGNLRLYPVLGYVETARKTEHGFDRVYFEKNLTS